MTALPRETESMALETAQKDLCRAIRRWYMSHRRRLPWRGTRDPYRIWISEVMLQQTTVAAVIPYYDRWFKLFPDLKSLARAPLQKVLKAWEGLGYYQRAKNIHRAARIICGRYGGSIPSTYEEILSLPGVGPYIASAVLSIAYQKPFPVLDGNVRRLSMRLWAIPGKTSARVDRVLIDRIRELFPARNPGDFNQALMDLGAVVCRPQNPRCLLCPVQGFCRAFQKGEQEVIPGPRKRSYQKIETVVGIITDGRRYLIQKRPSQGLLADLWEFPGGKREKGETLREALDREIREELQVEVSRARLVLKLRHAYTRFQVSLFAFECELKDLPRRETSVLRWVLPRTLKRYPFPSGSAKIIRFLEARNFMNGRNASPGS